MTATNRKVRASAAATPAEATVELAGQKYERHSGVWFQACRGFAVPLPSSMYPLLDRIAELESNYARPYSVTQAEKS